MTDLYDIEIFKNKLTSLDLSNQPKISIVHAEQNQLTTIKLPPKVPFLKEFRLWENKFTEISIPDDLPQLTHLQLYQNLLSTIVIPTKLPKLKMFSLWGNKFAEVLFVQYRSPCRRVRI